MAAIATSACKEDDNCSIHPEPFRFSIIDKEAKTDMLAEEVYIIDPEDGLYYFSNDERHSLIVNRETNPEGNYTELFSTQLPMVNLMKGVETFYLVLNEEDTDTLKVVMGWEKQNGCDFHPYAEVKHNGKDIDIIEGDAFILEKETGNP